MLTQNFQFDAAIATNDTVACLTLKFALHSPGCACGWVYMSCIQYVFRLHRMHEMQTIVTDVRGVCPSVSLSRGVIQCSLYQITLPLLNVMNWTMYFELICLKQPTRSFGWSLYAYIEATTSSAVGCHYNRRCLVSLWTDWIAGYIINVLIHSNIIRHNF